MQYLDQILEELEKEYMIIRLPSPTGKEKIIREEGRVASTPLGHQLEGPNARKIFNPIRLL